MPIAQKIKFAHYVQRLVDVTIMAKFIVHNKFILRLIRVWCELGVNIVMVRHASARTTYKIASVT